MKRIAFFQDNLDVGGIQKSIVNLLRNFDYVNYQVDLYLSEKKSFWNYDFPKELNIKYLRPIPRIYSFMPFDTARRLVKLDFSGVEEYDLAIDFNSYQFSCALGALSVPAKRRVMWIHNNVSVKLRNEWKYRVLWTNFRDKFKYYDAFVGVSAGVVQPFMECSGMHDKPFFVIQNTIDTKEIYEKAEDKVDFEPDPDKMNFVAIGRLCHQKAYDIMLEVFSQVSEKRDDIHLYIIGDGDKRLSLEYMRDSMGLTDVVTFLGQKTNPFCYMDKMDAFVSTSRYEGQPLNIMEAKALGLPLYCTKNLERYSAGLQGKEDIVSAIIGAQREEKHRDDLRAYNEEIISGIKALAETDFAAMKRKSDKEKLSIISLHLGTGGIEKAIINMANMFAEDYDVKIYSLYNIDDAPAFKIDERVKVQYMLYENPNREEWKSAAKKLRPIQFVRESLHSARVILGKKHAVRRAIALADEGVLITTRHEDNLLLSKYGKKNVLKIAQIHHDHNFEKNLVKGFKYGYGGIDVLAMLTPQLRDEVQEMMQGHNRHTKVVYIPNFLTAFPQDVEPGNREKSIVCVGRFSEVKRFNLLVKQFAHMHERIPDWTLRLVGDGEDMESLQKQVCGLGADEYIIFTGRKDAKGVEEELRRASAFAMTSRSEGFPFVLMEAQSCALPVVAYDVRVGPGFVVHEGVDGFLVPEGDEQEFEDRLAQLCDDEVLRLEMANNALKAIQQFSKENVRKIWNDVIEG